MARGRKRIPRRIDGYTWNWCWRRLCFRWKNRFRNSWCRWGNWSYACKDDEPIACNCGNHGCLEQYVSATGIVTQAKKTLEQDTRSSSLRNYASLEAKNIYDEAKNGDEIANEVVNLTCKILAKSLAQVCCVIDPEIIVIGGGVSKAEIS